MAIILLGSQDMGRRLELKQLMLRFCVSDDGSIFLFVLLSESTDLITTIAFACISSLAKMIDYLDWWFGSIENITVPLYFACLSYVELEHFRIPSTDLQCITTRPYALITGLIPL